MLSKVNPLVSVILPVYNGEAFLKLSIESVLVQSHKNLQLIIIDDGSNDDSKKIISEYTSLDNRILHVDNTINIGLQSTLNKGVSLSKGKYIARIDCDDIWCDQDKLKKQVEYMEANPDCGLLGTSIIIINEYGDFIKKVNQRVTDKSIRNTILQSNQFTHPSVLLRKNCLDELGVYAEGEKELHVEDYDLWLRIGRKYKFANLPDYCIKYRFLNNSVSRKNRFVQKIRSLSLAFKYRNDYPNFLISLIKRLVWLIMP